MVISVPMNRKKKQQLVIGRKDGGKKHRDDHRSSAVSKLTKRADLGGVCLSWEEEKAVSHPKVELRWVWGSGETWTRAPRLFHFQRVQKKGSSSRVGTERRNLYHMVLTRK